MKKFTTLIFLLVIGLTTVTLHSCKDDCDEPIPEDKFSIINPKEIYEIGFRKSSLSDFYVINNYKEFEDVLLGIFGYRGSYRYNGSSDLIVGIGVYVDHLGFEPLAYEIKKYIDTDEIEIVITAKEKYKSERENPGYHWVWLNIPKTTAKIEAIRHYELVN